MKLITEHIHEEYEMIHEQSNPTAQKVLKIKGPYFVAETRNANKRIYTRPLLEKSIAAYKKNYINVKNAMCEMGHPAHTNIDYDRVCAITTKLVQEGNIWIGESEVLTSDPSRNIKGTPHGDILASILQHGGRPGVSSRGVGEISKGNIIDTTYTIVAVDVVSNPSGPGCFVDGILESKEFMIDTHGTIMEIAIEKFEKELAILPATHITMVKEQYIFDIFDNFKNNIGRL